MVQKGKCQHGRKISQYFRMFHCGRGKIWTLEPEYGTIYIVVLGFFLVIEGGVVIGVAEHWQQRRNLRN